MKNINLKNTIIRDIIKQKWLYMMVIPGVVFMLIFNYIPMYGLIIAFKDYNIIDGISNAPWVGFDNFIEFFRDEKFNLVMKNTIGISVLKLLIGFPIPIIFAIFLNEIANSKYKKFVQTISYLPHFFSWVILAGLLSTWLGEYGLINEVLIKLGIAQEPIKFLTDVNKVWGLAIGSDIWKETGWNAIIYLAAISGIDPTLYEAASLDGASKLQKIWHITLPSIKGIIVMLLVLSVSGILGANFDQMLLLQNNMNIERSEVIDTLVYKIGIRQGNFSFATAVGLFRSIIALTLLIFANKVTKKLNDRSIF